MTGRRAAANSHNGDVQRMGTEEYVSLDAVLHLLGLTSDEYEAQKEAPCREIDLPDRIGHVIARFSNRGAGLSPSSYDLERILGTNDLVGVEYLTRGVRAAAAVGRILIRDEAENASGYATGFMVGPGLLLTNRHVLPTKEVAASSMVEFGYEKDERGVAKPLTQVYCLDPSQAYYTGTTEELDFAICGVGTEEQRGTPGASLSQWGYLRLDKQLGKVAELEFVSIIQHPGGDYKQVALRENKIISKKSPDVLLYQSDTAPGSSGSPVFNDQWQVVALHSRGVRKQSGDSNGVAKTSTVPADGKYEANLGVRISAIVKALEAFPDATRNAAVQTLLEDVQLGGLPVASVQDTGAALERTMKKRKAAAQYRGRANTAAQERMNLETRTGYDLDFLGVPIPVPDSAIAQERFGEPVSITNSDGSATDVLDYMHFSLQMCRSRKLCYWTAVNIDGATAADPARDNKFVLDPRLKEGEQCGDELYKRERHRWFDRGHMVRRKDPCWGNKFEVNAGNLDSMYFPNVCPQYKKVNEDKSLWAGVEDYILDNASKDKLQLSVFTGPVFNEKDARFRGVQIPAAFWKVVALVDGGRVRSSAYVVKQEEFVTAKALKEIDEEILPLGDPLHFQVSVKSLVELIGIDFGPDILAGDAGKGLAAKTPKKKGGRGKTAPVPDTDEESLMESAGLGVLRQFEPLNSFESIRL
ncbi:Uncharacterized protein y4fB [Coccomyxa sp. Obi]|nr:Uncharacterized protein y4fB [Coccomyxa sp. Obi]